MDEMTKNELPAGADTAPAAEDEPATFAPRVQNAKPRSRAFTVTVVSCIVVLVALVLLGSLLNVGDHLMSANLALGWTFYGIIAVLVVVGVIVPIVKVARRPVFSLYQLRDDKGRAKQRRVQLIIDNLRQNVELTDDDDKRLQDIGKSGDYADDLLIAFFQERVVPAMDAETKRAASTAFFVAAICRSPLVNSVTMLSLCLDLVRAIVETCGFRPTNLALAKLYARVMVNALIIGGIEDSDLSDLLAQLMGGGAGARVGGLVIGSAAEGLVSAFLVFRVGIIAKKWLTASDGPARMSSIRRTSYREALSLMRSGDFMASITATFKQFGGTVAHGVGQKAAQTARSAVESVKSVFEQSPSM